MRRPRTVCPLLCAQWRVPPPPPRPFSGPRLSVAELRALADRVSTLEQRVRRLERRTLVVGGSVL